MNNSVEQNNLLTGGTAKVIYILYVISLIFGITAIIGVVLAYINQDDAPEWLRSHYQFQIRTFWIGLLYLLIGTILTFILIGYLVLLFSVLWLIIRCAKGFKTIGQGQPHANPTAWLF